MECFLYFVLTFQYNFLILTNEIFTQSLYFSCSSRDLDSFDISSDSEGILDEIVITPSSFDFQQYDLQNSPIHICDNSIQSDETNSTNNHHRVHHSNHHQHQHFSHTHHLHHHHYHHTQSGNDESDITSVSVNSSNQLTTESCTAGHKNSSSRRMEYSMRGMKLTGSNPSQDSAFGSMTDGEQSIASSSLRLSSFQSISSPIDEGVEDISNSVLDLVASTKNVIYSNISTPCKESASHADNHMNIARSTSDSVALEKNSMMMETALVLEPPKILVNDQSSFYTTSPSKACGTIEVFSQKYRVSSFEDMSLRKTSLKNVNKLAFRSLEEERRIDSAFQPITTSDNNRVFVYNNEKFKKLTHAAFSRKISSTKERHTKWKNSILARKNNLIKSNESLLDHLGSGHGGGVGGGHGGSVGSSHIGLKCCNLAKSRITKRVNSTNELYRRYDSSDNIGGFGGISGSVNYNSSSFIDAFHNNPRKSRSERHLFSLCKLKQNAINDYDEVVDDDEDDDDVVADGNGFGMNRSEIVSFIDETSSSGGDGSTSDDSSSSPSHRDVCQIIGGLVEPDINSSCAEEKTPLLDGMEMSPISPVETDPLL